MLCKLTGLSVLLTFTIAYNTTNSLTLFRNITTSLFFWGGDEGTYVASVIGSNPPVTTYVLDCDDGHIAEDCGLQTPLTLVNGPSTASWSTYLLPGLEWYFNCSITGKTTGTCTASQSRAATFDFSLTSILSLDSGDIADGVTSFALNSTDVTYRSIIITAGPTTTTSALGPTVAGVTGSAGNASPAGTPSGNGATVTTAGSTRTALASASSSGGASSEGMPLPYQNLGLLLGGMLIAAGLAHNGI